MKLVHNAPKEEASAILASKGKIHVLEQKSPQFGSGGKQQAFENLFCVYCKKWNHTKETCFKLKNRNQRQGQAYPATTQVDEGLDGDVSCSNQPKKMTQGQIDDMTVLKEKIKKLEAMFASTSMAHANEYTALLSTHTSTIDLEWIFNSRATHHMTPNKSKFIPLSMCDTPRRVLIAGTQILHVDGIGDVEINVVGILKNVLHVPNLSAQLMSSLKFSTDINCLLIFYSDKCYVYDKGLTRKIGTIREKEGLLIFEGGRFATTADVVAKTPSKRSRGDNAQLLNHLKIIHFCFGHPSFELLWRMFPPFVKDIDLSNVTCDTCQLTKHKRNSFK